jgi:hypothetical protein
MGKFFKGLLVVIGVFAIAALVEEITKATMQSSLGNNGILINLIFVVPMFIFLTWIISIPLSSLSHMNPAIYFGLCLIGSVAILIVQLKGDLFSGKELSDSAKIIGFHSALVFVLIPKIDSQYEDYLVTETTYMDGFEIDKREYIEGSYISGSFIKLLLVAGIGVIGGYFIYKSLVGKAPIWVMWVFFGIEAGFSLFKFIQSIFAMRR